MPVHIEDLQSTVEIQGEAEHPTPAQYSVPDELTERMRRQREQRDCERLEADGYAD